MTEHLKGKKNRGLGKMTSFTAAQAGPSARRVGAHPLPGGREPLPAEAL